MAVRRRAVRWIARIARARLFHVSREAVAHVEGSHQVHDLATLSQGIERRVRKTRDGVERVQLQQQILTVETAHPERIVELTSAVDLADEPTYVDGVEPVRNGLDRKIIDGVGTGSRLDGGRVADARVEQLGPASAMVVSAR